MKKLFTIALVLMFAAGAAYAEERLSLSGNFRVQGWSTEAKDWNSDTEEDWLDQRLRIGGKIAVADDVSVNFRMDFGEGVWGQDYGPGYVTRPRGNPNDHTKTIDIDRGFVSIKKEMWELDAGQMFMGLGVSEVLDANATGAIFRLKPSEALRLSLLYAKIDESGSKSDEGDLDDVDFYGVNIGYKSANFENLNFSLFGGMQTDGSASEEEGYALGLNARGAFGPINLVSEIAMLDGDDAAGVDAKGLQFFLAGDGNITEMSKVGAELFYAKGYDGANEAQITGFSDWFTFTPMGYNTPQSGNFSAFQPNGGSSPFDPSNDGAGALGGTLWAQFDPIENLKLGAKVGYWGTDTDNTDIDSIFAWNAWASYMIASNTNLSITYLNSTPDLKNNAPVGTTDDTYKVGVLELMINF